MRSAEHAQRISQWKLCDDHGAVLMRKNSTGIWLQTSHPSGCIVPFLNISFISRVNFLHLLQHQAKKISCLLDII